MTIEKLMKAKYENAQVIAFICCLLIHCFCSRLRIIVVQLLSIVKNHTVPSTFSFFSIFIFRFLLSSFSVLTPHFNRPPLHFIPLSPHPLPPHPPFHVCVRLAVPVKVPCPILQLCLSNRPLLTT